MSWDQALAEWEAWSRASGHARNTIRQRRYQLRRFADDVGVDDPWQVTLRQMVTWLGSHPEWSKGTRFAHRQTLRSLFAFAVDYGYIADDPTDRLPKMRVPKGTPHPTPDSVFDSALERADDRGRLILMLGAYAGLRRAEIAGLRWEHVNATQLRITGKGDRVRLVPLHPDLAAELDAARLRPAQMAAAWVFPGNQNGHLAPETVWRIAGELLGEGSTHGLRHRFASRAYAAERDLLAVQRLLGHVKIETTLVYAQVPDGALERAVLAAGGAP